MVRPVVSLGLFVALFAAAARPPVAGGTELCRTHRKTLVVRDECKLREERLTPSTQEELGMTGPTGPAGPVGPSTGDLKLLDANGADAGLVMRLTDYYYGQSADVIRFMTLPGETSPEFVLASMRATGLNQNNECQGALYETAACTGQAYADCNDLAQCDSTAGAFTQFFRVVTGDPERGACFLGDASELHRGDFFRRGGIRAFSPQQVTTQCAQRAGVLISGPEPCAPNRPIYCGICCSAVGHRVGVPEHVVDPAILGTPPFRLAR